MQEKAEQGIWVFDEMNRVCPHLTMKIMCDADWHTTPPLHPLAARARPREPPATRRASERPDYLFVTGRFSKPRRLSQAHCSSIPITSARVSNSATTFLARYDSRRAPVVG